MVFTPVNFDSLLSVDFKPTKRITNSKSLKVLEPTSRKHSSSVIADADTSSQVTCMPQGVKKKRLPSKKQLIFLQACK
jgi:hypothetical protein